MEDGAFCVSLRSDAPVSPTHPLIRWIFQWRSSSLPRRHAHPRHARILPHTLPHSSFSNAPRLRDAEKVTVVSSFLHHMQQRKYGHLPLPLSPPPPPPLFFSSSTFVKVGEESGHVSPPLFPAVVSTDHSQGLCLSPFTPLHLVACSHILVASSILRFSVPPSIECFFQPLFLIAHLISAPCEQSVRHSAPRFQGRPIRFPLSAYVSNGESHPSPQLGARGARSLLFPFQNPLTAVSFLLHVHSP